MVYDELYEIVIKKLYEVRRILNLSLFRAKHYKNREYWNQMWASCDVLEDTCIGIEYYIKCDYKEDNTGSKYLYLYGLLQLLFVQQDALWHLSEALEEEIKPSDTPKIEEIREIRNCSIGHSTKKGWNKNLHEFISISQISINKSSFEYVKWIGGKCTIHSANIDDMLETQLKWLNECLDKLMEYLKGVWDTMSNEYKKIKMIDLFLPNLNYHIEKLATRDAILALGYGYEGIKTMFDNIVKEIKLRYGNRELQGTSYLIKEISFILNFFYEVLKQKREYIEIEYGLFSELLHIKMDELKRHCIEIDKDIDIGIEKPNFEQI